MEKTKLCSKCKLSLPVTSFCKCRQKKDGLQTQCKECKRISKQENYAANPEHYRKYAREQSKNISDESKAKRSARERRYRAENPEKYRQMARASYHKNKVLKPIERKPICPECVSAGSRKTNCSSCKSIYKESWRQKNISRLRNRAHDLYIKNRQSRRSKQKEWNRHNKDKLRAITNKRTKELDDNYIKQTIYSSTKIPRPLIPGELIEAKREHLKLTRKLKDLKNEKP